jgi:hypothetical protein
MPTTCKEWNKGWLPSTVLIMKCRGLRKKGDETEPYSNSTCEKSESDYI